MPHMGHGSIEQMDQKDHPVFYFGQVNDEAQMTVGLTCQ